MILYAQTWVWYGVSCMEPLLLYQMCEIFVIVNCTENKESHVTNKKYKLNSTTCTHSMLYGDVSKVSSLVLHKYPSLS